MAAMLEEVELKRTAKISDLLRNASGPVVSIECFPPKTDEGVETLFRTLPVLMEMSKRPVFVDFTWGAGGSTSDLTLDLCARVESQLGAVANMHLTCTNMEAGKIDSALATCKAKGITNILALRGDPPVGQERWIAAEGGFSCALDLVRYIRKLHGDFFCVSVAGYPEGHPEKMSVVEDESSLSDAERKRARRDGTQLTVCRDADFAAELDYLQKKVDAGADCIITQMFFDAEVYASFVTACRARGISCPIVPGLMLINSHAGFLRMTSVSHFLCDPIPSSSLIQGCSSARVVCLRNCWRRWTRLRRTSKRCAHWQWTSECACVDVSSSWARRVCTSTHSTHPPSPAPSSNNLSRRESCRQT